MNNFQSSALALFIVILLSGGLTKAQQTNSTAQNQHDANSALREKAFDLLESLAGQINGLQSGENRARIGSNIVGSLWGRDEKRARTLLVAVEEDIKAGLQSSTGDDPTDSQTFMVFLRLREDTIERIAKHDPETALAFLKATEFRSDKIWNRNVDRSRAIELRLAKLIASHNPDIALKLGRESLTRGFSNELLLVLRQLSRQHKEHSQLLFKEIVIKLRDAEIVGDWAAMTFALNLAHSFKPPLVDDSNFRELINIFISSALANGCGKDGSSNDTLYFCQYVGSLLPDMERVDPVRASHLKKWVSDGDGWRSYQQPYNELNDLSQNGTVEDILALAANYPQIEGEIYHQAMMKAAAGGDFERARKIANDYTGAPDHKQRMLDRLAHYEKSNSISDEELAEIQRTLSTLPQVMDRLRVLMRTADRINNRSRALQLLNQANGIAETMKPGIDQTAVQMALAMMYCFEKSDRGFAIMESLLPRFNELIASGAKLDGYDTHYLRDGEWNMTGEGNLGKLLTALANNSGFFAWCDFDRAVSLANQFERQEIRVMAHLKLAQAILAGPPKRLDLGSGRY